MTIDLPLHESRGKARFLPRAITVVLIGAAVALAACSSNNSSASSTTTSTSSAPSTTAAPASSTTAAVTPTSSGGSSTGSSVVPTTKPPLPTSAIELVNCSGGLDYTPTNFILSCADDDVFLRNIQWHTPTGPNQFEKSTPQDQQTATATLVKNDCTPTCVAGHDVAYPNASVTVATPQPAPGTNYMVWTTMTITYQTSSGSTATLNFSLQT